MPFDIACNQARTIMAGMYAPWSAATCDAIAAEVCKPGSTLFVGNDPIRTSLCSGPPAPSGGGGGYTPSGGGGGGFAGLSPTTLIIGGVAILALVLIMSQGRR